MTYLADSLEAAQYNTEFWAKPPVFAPSWIPTYTSFSLVGESKSDCD